MKKLEEWIVYLLCAVSIVTILNFIFLQMNIPTYFRIGISTFIMLIILAKLFPENKKK